MIAKLIHANGFQRIVHAAAQLILRNAKIFRPEGDILLRDRCNDLVIRVLKYHPACAADLIQQRLVRRVHPGNKHTPARRKQDRVKMLEQRGFPGAVMTQDRDILPGRDRKLNPIKHQRTLRIREGERLGF